jgi:hypothetical protein
MSFQAYLDNIRAKTGKSPEEFKALAAEKGLIQTKDILSWLKTDFGLGHGHAMAIVHLIVHEKEMSAAPEEKIDKLFAGTKAKWRKPFDDVLSAASSFGPEFSSSVGQTYVNLLRNGKKFAIVQPSSAERLDIGIKLKQAEHSSRFEPAGTWNSMVTHRVKITDAAQIDSEVIEWLKLAYEAAI